MERLLVYARCLAADIPRGQLGSAVAVELTTAVCEACRLRLLDITGSALAIFDALVRLGLMRSMPSQRVMPAALALVASVSPLVERRSPRCWTIRSSHALEPESAVGRAIRERVPVRFTSVADDALGGPRPPSSIRGERDQLQAELRAARADIERLTGELAVGRDEHAALATRVVAAEDAAVRTRTELTAERSETKRLQDALGDVQAQRDRDAQGKLELLAAFMDLEHRYRDLTAEQTSLKTSRASAVEHIEVLQQQVAAAREERDRAKRMADSLQGQVIQLQRDLSAMQAARDRANEDAATRRTELKTATTDIAALQTRLEKAAHDLAAEQAARREADSAAAAAVKARMDLLQTRIDHTEKDLKAARSERDSALDNVAEHRAQGERARKALAEARDRISVLEYDAAILADKHTASQQGAVSAKNTIVDLEAKLKEAATNRRTHENSLATLTQERDRLRHSLAEESKARHTELEQQKRLTQELAAVRGARDAANEKIEVARERLRRQTAEIAVRQLRAPLSVDIITREVDALLGRSRG